MPYTARNKLKGASIADPSDVILEQGKQQRDELAKMEWQHRPAQRAFDQNGVPVKGPGAMFPVKQTAFDPDDDRFEMKMKAPAALGFKMLEEKDLQNLQRKADQQQYAQVEQFAEQYFDMTNPAICRMVEQIMPNFFSRRLAELEQTADLQMRIAKLRLYGVKDEEDIFLEFALRSGKIPIPTGPLWDPAQPANAAENENNYYRGLCNPKRWTAMPRLPGMGARWDVASNGITGYGANQLQSLANQGMGTMDVAGWTANNVAAAGGPNFLQGNRNAISTRTN